MSCAVKVYALAGFYKVEELQDVAAEKLKELFELGPGYSFIDFTNSIKLIEERSHPTDTTLWNIVLSVMRTHIGDLLEDPRFQKLVFERRELSLRLLWMLGRPLCIKNHVARDPLGQYNAEDFDWSRKFPGPWVSLKE